MLAVALLERDRHGSTRTGGRQQDAVLDRIETSIALLRGAAGLFASREEDPTREELERRLERQGHNGFRV